MSKSTIDDYDLGEFDISENGVISFDGGVNVLINGHCFVRFGTALTDKRF